MKMLLMASAGMLFVGCAQQRVTDALAQATEAEGKQYAAEMAAQSPFKTVEMRWSEAGRLMEKRNRAFIAAKEAHAKANEKKPEVGVITGEVKRAVASSVGGVLSPGALLESMRSPALQLPKQLASLGGIKDVPHHISQSAWDDACASVDAEFAMRRERVKLHRLLCIGELIDQELVIARESPVLPEDVDPAVGLAIEEWRSALNVERGNWLGEMRDLFDAEYHDVRLVRDSSGLAMYREIGEPNLSDWQRWCRLAREKELVASLGKAHADRKPSIPGMIMVSNKFGEIVGDSGPEKAVAIREPEAVRREVRTLVQSWRKMKQAQHEAEAIEVPSVLASAPDVNTRKRNFHLRKTEIEHAGVIWLMDEQCWR